MKLMSLWQTTELLSLQQGQEEDATLRGRWSLVYYAWIGGCIAADFGFLREFDI